MKPEPLDGKEGYVDSWQIRDKKDVHPSHRTKVFEAKDIKSACDFYLRYRYNPELLAKEYPELKEEMIKRFGFDFAFWSEKWLFKLAFKDVFKEVEQE